MDNAKKLASFEIGWWKAHHRKHKDLFLENMTQLYILQFGISPDIAEKAVLLRIEAADWHDMAEEEEDKGNQADADKYWGKAEKALYEHFELLESD